MIHSASFLASGSEIEASAWVASDGLCLRTRSMTVASVSLSLEEVEEVAATAAGIAGLRAIGGGSVACWRVAGAITAGAAVATDLAPVLSLSLAADLSASLPAAFSVFGTTLRATGRDFGNGTLCLAAASFAAGSFAAVSFARACEPGVRASANVVARVVTMAVERKAAARAERVTAFLSDESRKTSS